MLQEIVAEADSGSAYRWWQDSTTPTFAYGSNSSTPRPHLLSCIFGYSYPHRVYVVLCTLFCMLG